jgi:hypothetical protein
VTGATKLWVKYTCDSGATPATIGCGTVDREAVPPDVRNLQCLSVRADSRQPAASPRENAQSRAIVGLVAAFEQPLHAQADAEQRAAIRDRSLNRLDPFGAERGGRREVTDARDDDADARVSSAGASGIQSSAPRAANALRTEVKFPAL